MDNSVGIDCGSVGWAEEGKGGKTETTVINNKNDKNKKQIKLHLQFIN